jgi:hypothetical protein
VLIVPVAGNEPIIVSLLAPHYNVGGAPAQRRGRTREFRQRWAGGFHRPAPWPDCVRIAMASLVELLLIIRNAELSNVDRVVFP